MVALFRRREQIQPVALAHVFHVLPAGGIGALVHNQRVGARALEVHLPVDKAVLRADGNRQIALPPAVKPRRIKRGSLAAGGAGQAHQPLIRQRVRLKHVRRGQRAQRGSGNAALLFQNMLKLHAPLGRERRHRPIHNGQQRRRTFRVVHRAVRRHIQFDVHQLHRRVQVHLLVLPAEAAEAEDELRVDRRRKRHRGHKKRGVALEHGIIVPPPRHKLRILAAPRDKIAEDIRKRAPLRKLLLGDARHLLDMLIQPLIHARANQLAEARNHVPRAIHAARADFDDLVRHAVVRVIAALVPFQIKNDDILYILTEQRKHVPHPIKRKSVFFFALQHILLYRIGLHFHRGNSVLRPF